MDRKRSCPTPEPTPGCPEMSLPPLLLLLLLPLLTLQPAGATLIRYWGPPPP